MSTELNSKIEETRNLLKKLEEEKKLEQFENLDFSNIELPYPYNSFSLNNMSEENKLIFAKFLKKYGYPDQLKESFYYHELNFGWKLNKNYADIVVSFRLSNSELNFEKDVIICVFISVNEWLIEEKFEFNKDSFKNIQDFIESNLKEVQVEYTQKACVPAFVLECVSEDDYATWLDHFKNKNQLLIDGKKLNM